MSPPRHSEEAIGNAGELGTKLTPRDTSTQDIEFTSSEPEAVQDGRDGPKANTNATSLMDDENSSTEFSIVSNVMAGGIHPLNSAERHEVKNVPIETEHESEHSHTSSTAADNSFGSTDPMESSTATLRPEYPMIGKDSNDVHLKPKDNKYLDPTPETPLASFPPSRTASAASSIPRLEPPPKSMERSPTRSDSGFDDKQSGSEDEREADSKAEIQSIMDQFSEEGGGPGVEEVMSPRLEFAGPLLGSPIQHPPRKSSLEPLNPAMANALQSMESLRLAPSPSSIHQSGDMEKGPPVPPKPSSIHSFGPRIQEDRYVAMDSPLSQPPPPHHRPPPPDPEPEPDLPFDFHRFLEQLRHRTADPVAKFLRSFLQEFGKKQWMVHEQVKIIGDFLAFITNKMAQCDVWREVSDAEFDNAREGMEKLVMNRLYTQTFSPAIPPPQMIPGPRSKRKNVERPTGPGRRGQHQEDVERDDILAQKVRIYGWVKEEHLDIPPVGDSGRRFLLLAQQELLKIKTYRAPRDKIICVLNCCKVIFGLLKHSKADSSADSFMPLLIYVVLQANPEHLVSNVQYILRFRNQDKLVGEAGYYLSSLMGAIQFIENLDRTTLTISDDEFERNVEAAVFAIAERHRIEEAQSPTSGVVPEKAGAVRSEASPRQSMEGDSSVPRQSTSSYDNDVGDGSDEKAAMSGLLRTIQRPLSSIGRIFADEPQPTHSGPARTPLPGNTPRLSPALRGSLEPPQSPPRPSRDDGSRKRLTAEEAAARQASAEAAEAHRIQQAEHTNVVETLAGMFPDLDRDIISDVVVQKNGRVGLAVDACLALSA